jgi:hypothetical protein
MGNCCIEPPTIDERIIKIRKIVEYNSLDLDQAFKIVQIDKKYLSNILYSDHPEKNRINRNF